MGLKAQDIAVAGAGPAGLAAALYLRLRGHKVTIFERFDQPAPVGSGLILQPTGLTVLHDLGLLDEILALGSRIDRLYGADARTGRTVLDVRYNALQGKRFGLGVHRAALFGALYRAVKREKIPIETNVLLGDVESEPGRITLLDNQAKKLGRFSLVVDACGARSPLRRHVHVPADPAPLIYGAFWGSLNWPAGKFDPNALLQRYDKASVMIGVLPIGRAEKKGPRMAAFFWSLRPTDAASERTHGLDAWKARVTRLWPDCEAFTEQIDSFDQLSLARYGHHTLILPTGWRLCAIGDAAHSTSPQLGQGANMALLDARALAFALETQPDMEQVLAAYSAARRAHVRLFQGLSWLFTPFYQSDSLTLPFIRDRFVALLARVPPVPQVLASMVAGTLTDPFKKVGLREVDWSALGVRPEE